MHSYYCTHCHILIFGTTTERLCENLNFHNNQLHPTDFHGWASGIVVRSKHYHSDGQILSQYTAPYGTTSKSEWGGATPPIITDEDQQMLKRMRVKW